MRGRLLIFCGIPGSGKTTIAKIVAQKIGNAVHIQTDTIRSMLLHPRYTSKESRFVYSSAMAIARQSLKDGYHAILDGTFLKEEYRAEVTEKLLGFYQSVLIVYVACDLFTAYERNTSRRAAVPRESFIRLYSNFEVPRNALSIDTEKTTPELAAQAILLQVTGQTYA